jgi:hypothetical protein
LIGRREPNNPQALQPPFKTHVRGVDLLSGVQSTSDVVVDGLLHWLAILHGLHLFMSQHNTAAEFIKGSFLYICSSSCIQANTLRSLSIIASHPTQQQIYLLVKPSKKQDLVISISPQSIGKMEDH